MEKDQKNIGKTENRDFVDERTESIRNRTENDSAAEHQEDVKAEEGSKSDPQLTELDGLKKGGVPPHVNPGDEEKVRKTPSSDR